MNLVIAGGVVVLVVTMLAVHGAAAARRAHASLCRYRIGALYCRRLDGAGRARLHLAPLGRPELSGLTALATSRRRDLGRHQHWRADGPDRGRGCSQDCRRANSPPRSWSAPAWRASPSSSRRSRPGPSSTASARWSEAKAADAKRREGKGIGPLHGVPSASRTSSIPPTCRPRTAARAFKGRLPFKDAACVTALRRAGAVVLGKTVTTELATFTPGTHAQPAQSRAHAGRLLLRLRGRRRRRHGARRARHADGGLRHPARGLLRHLRLQADLRAHPAPRRAHAGAVARHRRRLSAARSRTWPSLADALQGLRRARSRQPGLAAARVCWRPPPRTGRCAPLFAFVKTHAWSEADAATHEAFGELIEQLGGQVQEISIDNTTERGFAAARHRAEGGAGASLRPAPRPGAELLSPGLAKQIEEGAAGPGRRVSGRAQRARGLLRDVEELLRDYGTILTPAALGPGAQGPRQHRQPRLLRLLDLPRRAGGDAAAAGGRRPAHGRAADRRRAATTAACCAARAGSCATSSSAS